MPIIREHELMGEEPPAQAHVHTREVYHQGAFHDFDVWQMAELQAGNVIKGPAIIRDPMTTLVVPPGKHVEFDQYMVIHYR